MFGDQPQKQLHGGRFEYKKHTQLDYTRKVIIEQIETVFLMNSSNDLIRKKLLQM